MKKSLFFLGALTLINAAIFLARNHFQYQPYKTYASLYQQCDADCVEKWSGYKKIYSAETLAQAKLISDKLITEQLTTLEKVQAISDALNRRFSHRIGQPTSTLLQMPAMQKFEHLNADTTQKLWCGIFAEMMALFCWSQNITCRNIEVYLPNNRHVMNECWIPELGQWVVTDAMLGIPAAAHNNQYLNLQQFVTSLHTKPNELKTNALNVSTRVEQLPALTSIKSFYGPDYDYYYYKVIDLNQVYRPFQKFVRYTLPVSWYNIYSSHPKSNYLFAVKAFLLAAWLLALLYTFFKLFVP